MLTYKKLLPQGIVGRHTLSSAESVPSELGEKESEGTSDSERSEYGSTATFTASGQESQLDRWEKWTPHRSQTYPGSRVGTAAPARAPRVPLRPKVLSASQSTVEPEQSEHEIEGPPANASASRLTSASTMTEEPKEHHYVTKDVIEESRLWSKKRAPGITQREFPLRSQSSGFSASEAQIMQGRISTARSVGAGASGYSPLKLNRVFGRNDKVAVLNLVGIHFSHIAYTAANVIVLFDFYANHQRMLQGHKNKITSLARNTKETRFASGDVGPASAIIVWDMTTGYPLRSFPVSKGDGDYGVTSLAFIGKEDFIGSMGNDMRFCEEESADPDVETGDQPGGPATAATPINVDRIIPVKEDHEKDAASEPEQNICIWQISSPESQENENHHHHHEKSGGKPVATFAIPKSVGSQRDISFCESRPEFFVTTGDKRVVFYTWLQDENRIVHQVPRRGMKFLPRVNRFTKSLWKSPHACITGTDIGYVIIWANPDPLGLKPPPDPRLNIKQYNRSYKVGDCAVTALISHKEWFIIGDEQGVVKFFDSKFRIVRWTNSSPQMSLRPITFISCNQSEELPGFKKEMQEHFDKREDQKQIVHDWTYGGEKFKQASQTTLERPGLFAPDFVIGCEGGDVHYVHLSEGRADQIVYGTPGEIVAMDTCPRTTHVTLSTLHGDIQMYDYVTNTLVFAGHIFKSVVEISCLKFHPTGSFAFFGMRNGQIYFRRAYTWKSMEAPLDNCSACIERIIFSRNGTNMAHYDASFAVTLYKYNSTRHSWSLQGKHRSHYRPIVDLAFFYDEVHNKERLFSLGQDKFLVEYDISICTQTNGLRIKLRYPIDTQFVPSAMTFDAPWREHKPILMIANTGNKIKFFDQDQKEVKKYCQGPVYGTPMDRILRISKPSPEYTDAGFLLMTLGDKIGLMKTPVDGNPFKNMAVLGHPGRIQNVAIGCSGKEIFTTGAKDDSLFHWEANISALETCVLSGGSGIKAYMKMLDADSPPGQSLVEDVENIFYHLLIRRSKDQQDMLSKKLEIPIIDMPLVLRTCESFLTEHQFAQMMEEAIVMGKIRDGQIPTMISFADFLKLFANYKESPSVTHKEVVEAFKVLGSTGEDGELFIPRDTFVEYLSEHGEKIDQEQLPYFFPALFQSEESIPLFEEEVPAWLDLIDTTSLLEEDKQAIALAKSRAAVPKKNVQEEEADDNKKTADSPTVDTNEISPAGDEPTDADLN